MKLDDDDLETFRRLRRTVELWYVVWLPYWTEGDPGRGRREAVYTEELEAFERFEAIAKDPGVEYVELLHGKPFGCLWTIRERTEEDLKETIP